MQLQLSETIWLDESGVCSIEHLAELSGLSQQELRELVESGVLEPVDAGVQPPTFFLHTVVTAQTARRLRDDFELDTHGLALALALLRRIEALEEELRARR